MVKCKLLVRLVVHTKAGLTTDLGFIYIDSYNLYHNFLLANKHFNFKYLSTEKCIDNIINTCTN